MKALLLAAGRGTRISRYLNGAPKCTVDIGNGMPLIQYTINALNKHGITDIAIVTGYCHEVIEELLAGQNVKFYYNPFFDVTNSIASAWFAREFLCDDDVVVMNADVFCSDGIYSEVLNLNMSPVMLYDTSRIEEADYKFYCEDGKVVRYGKELAPEETSGEYVGIAKIGKDFLPHFLKRMDDMINSQQNSVWWENVLYSLSAEKAINAYDICPQFWAEVDYIEDYERIISFVKSERI